jgi:integrase
VATLGLRRGELVGLRWQEVDLAKGRIAIRHTRIMVAGKPATAEPKTAKSRRSLTLAPEVLDALRAHRARQVTERLSSGAGYTDSGLVITTEDGRPMHPETLSGLFVRQAKQVGSRRSGSTTSGTRWRRSCWPRRDRHRRPAGRPYPATTIPVKAGQGIASGS